MRDAHPHIQGLGADQVTISGKSAAMAASLQQTVPFALLLDPDHTLRAQLGIEKLSLGQVASLASAKNYATSIRHARNAAVRPTEATLAPAVVILDADQKVVWQHIGEALGDYPPIDDIVDNIPSP